MSITLSMSALSRMSAHATYTLSAELSEAFAEHESKALSHYQAT